MLFLLNAWRAQERNIDFYTLALSSIVQSSGQQYWERKVWGGGNVIKDNIRRSGPEHEKLLSSKSYYPKSDKNCWHG